MAWQRVGCSHDGGSNVLGQMPRDYGNIAPQPPGPATGRRAANDVTSPRNEAANGEGEFQEKE